MARKKVLSFNSELSLVFGAVATAAVAGVFGPEFAGGPAAVAVLASPVLNGLNAYEGGRGLFDKNKSTLSKIFSIAALTIGTAGVYSVANMALGSGVSATQIAATAILSPIAMMASAGLNTLSNALSKNRGSGARPHALRKLEI